MLLIEGEQEGCLQPPTELRMGQASAGTSAPAPLHLTCALHPTTHPKLPPTVLFPPAPFSVLQQLPHGTTQVHTVPSPPTPVLGHLGDCPPIPRQALTHIVILEGMEKVASQLPVVSWSARGIANATYVVWRILWEMGGEAVSRSPQPPEMPRGQDNAMVTLPVSPSIRATAAPQC